MTLLVGPRKTKLSPTADDPLNGCSNKTRWLYTLIKEEPGIGQGAAATRMGIRNAQHSIETLISRGLIEVRQDGRYHNFLWPLDPACARWQRAYGR